MSAYIDDFLSRIYNKRYPEQEQTLYYSVRAAVTQEKLTFSTTQRCHVHTPIYNDLTTKNFNFAMAKTNTSFIKAFRKLLTKV